MYRRHNLKSSLALLYGPEHPLTDDPRRPALLLAHFLECIPKVLRQASVELDLVAKLRRVETTDVCRNGPKPPLNGAERDISTLRDALRANSLRLQGEKGELFDLRRAVPGEVAYLSFFSGVQPRRIASL